MPNANGNANGIIIGMYIKYLTWPLSFKDNLFLQDSTWGGQ